MTKRKEDSNINITDDHNETEQKEDEQLKRMKLTQQIQQHQQQMQQQEPVDIYINTQAAALQHQTQQITQQFLQQQQQQQSLPQQLQSIMPNLNLAAMSGLVRKQLAKSVLVE